MRRTSLLVVLIFLLVFTGACSTKGNDLDRSSPSDTLGTGQADMSDVKK